MRILLLILKHIHRIPELLDKERQLNEINKLITPKALVPAECIKSWNNQQIKE